MEKIETKKDCCGSCGISDVKIYRSLGSLYRPFNDRCNKCVSPEQRPYYIPCIKDEDGRAWGYKSVPQDALETFLILPDCDPILPTYGKNGWSDQK